MAGEEDSPHENRDSQSESDLDLDEDANMVLIAVLCSSCRDVNLYGDSGDIVECENCGEVVRIIES